MRGKVYPLIACFVFLGFCGLLAFAMVACEGETGPAGPQGPAGEDGKDGEDAAASCFTCHSDSNTAIIAARGQYDFSIHSTGNNIDRNFSSCSGCHVSEGFIVRTLGGTPGNVDNPTAIHCFTCHEPHTSGDLGLRVEVPEPLADGTIYDLGSANICVWCHQARRDVNTYVSTANDTTNITSRFWGPHHGTQGDMLIGSNGYEYLTYTYTQTEHRSITANGCKDCHFDATSNYRVGGHSFNMTYDDGVETFENTDACTPCHGDTDFDYASGQTNTALLLNQLEGLLMGANLLDADHHAVPRTVAANDSAGAVWNYLMVYEDRSGGVHNRKYMQDLLKSAIIFMGDTPVVP